MSSSRSVTDPVLSGLRSRTDDMLEDLRRLTELESPSDDLTATRTCARWIESWMASRAAVGPAEVIEIGGRTHLRWSVGARTRVLLVAHLDTVWPSGTIDRWPFRVAGDLATGPGVFDMKAGIVQMAYALGTIEDLDGVTVLVTSDEEVGSPTSRSLIEETATGAVAALVVEPSADGRLKTARKGFSGYQLEVTGRAAHAGLEPERGANATVAVALAVPEILSFASSDNGTSVTPTVLAAGTTANTVPAGARLLIDVRAYDAAEQLRVDEQVKSLRSAVPGTRFAVTGGINRPPLPAASSRELFALASEHAARLGLTDLSEVSVGGASDGNFTAGIGVRTLDGMGAVGGGAHAEGEFISVAAMPERAALLARMVTHLLGDPSGAA